VKQSEAYAKACGDWEGTGATKELIDLGWNSDMQTKVKANKAMERNKRNGYSHFLYCS